MKAVETSGPRQGLLVGVFVVWRNPGLVSFRALIFAPARIGRERLA